MKIGELLKMKRPGIVTGLACFNLMIGLSALWALDSGAQIGVDEVYLGSVFPVEWQWYWLVAKIGINCVTTIGLFSGWNWARWLLFALAIPEYIIAAPIDDGYMLPNFFFSLVLCALGYWLIFFSPGVGLYFARPVKGQPIFEVRGVISTICLIFAVCAAYFFAMAVFERMMLIKIAWFGMGAFVLPALILIAIIRWNIEVALREISAFLLSVAIYFACTLFSFFLIVRFAYPDTAMSYFDWLQTARLTLALGTGGLLLAAYATYRYRVASTQTARS